MLSTTKLVEAETVPEPIVQSEKQPKAISPLIFAASLFSGAVYFLLYPLAGIGPGPESLNLARSLADHGTFADPYHSFPTGYSAHMAPLYPLFLATLLRLLGNGS